MASPEEALGEVVAEETRRLLGGKGTVVILTEAGAGSGLDAAVERCQQALARHAGLKVGAVERLPAIDPLARTMNPGGSAIAPELFLRAVGAHAQADACVSFVGMPAFPPGVAGGAVGRTKLIAVWNGTGSAEVQPALAQGAVALAAVAREEAVPAAGSGSGSGASRARALFDQYYLLVAPEGER